MKESLLRILSHIIRVAIPAFCIWATICLFLSGPTIWPIEWYLPIGDLVGMSLFTFGLPLLHKRAPIGRSFIRAPLFPFSSFWPVWVVWFASGSLLIHGACALRSIII